MLAGACTLLFVIHRPSGQGSWEMGIRHRHPLRAGVPGLCTNFQRNPQQAQWRDRRVTGSSHSHSQRGRARGGQAAKDLWKEMMTMAKAKGIGADLWGWNAMTWARHWKQRVRVELAGTCTCTGTNEDRRQWRGRRPGDDARVRPSGGSGTTDRRR